MYFSIHLLPLLYASVDAMAFQSMPIATRVVLDALAEAPRPTTPPPYAELMKRQAASSVHQTGLLAPDNTCGYFGGRPGALFSCYNTDAQCGMLLPYSSGQWGNLLCCDRTACGARTSCIDQVQYSSQSICDNSCDKDTYVLKCTLDAAPFCNSLRFPQQSVEDFFCDASSVSSYQLITTSYTGETGHIWSTIDLDASTTSGAASSSAAILNTDNSVSATGSQGVGGGGTPQTTSSPSPSPTPAPSSGGSSTPTGAIAGGVVGGVAVIALASFVIWFFGFRKRKNKNNINVPANNVQQPPPNYTGGAGGAYAQNQNKPPMGQQTYYDQNTGQYVPTQQGMQQPYQQNQAYNPANAGYGGQQGQYGMAGAGVGAAAAQQHQQQTQQQKHISEVEGSTLAPTSAHPSNPTSPMSESGRVVSGAPVSELGSPGGENRRTSGYGGQDGDIHEMSATSGPFATQLHG